ncbi:hypothetical protein CBS9595_003671 [Malassezia furfur]|nr:hypothetical protein CBS9595_003671 [Malassezia furfur]
MSAPVAAYRRLRRQLRPHQYNLVFFLWIGLVMLSGTLYSIYYQTHLFNTEYSATRALDYTAAKAMHADVPSMFADRRNWMNTLFVKRAWFWNTLVVLLVAVTLDPASGGVRGEKARGVVFRGPQTWREVLGLKPLVRWVEATIGWDW